MQDIHCETPDCKRFLARINGGRLEIFCVRCKRFHAVELSELVKLGVADLRNGHEPEGETKLLW